MSIKGKANIKEQSRFSRKMFVYSKWDDWGGADIVWGYVKEMNSYIPNTCNL